MKEYHLNYYPNFRCVADKCKHTCCAGWEMCIDSDTLLKYKKDASPFSNALKSGINFKKSKFKADKLKRCAFLNEMGLCEIIINLGENSLCQVCRDHPRFRSFFADRVETGLGFSCEQATRIILSFKDKIKPTLISDDKGKEQLDFIEQSVLAFREKAIEIIQDRNLCINDRINILLKECKADFCDKDFNKVIKAFKRFEKLDKSFSKRLKKTPFSTSTDDSLSLYAEQFLVNGLYRHLSGAEDTTWVRARAIACVLSWWVVKSLYEQQKEGDFSTICDIVRAFSSEVEYSQKNLDKLFALSYKFVKI